MSISDQLERLFDRHVARDAEELARRATTGCAHVIATRRGETIADLWRGASQLVPEERPCSSDPPRFDWASVTKVVVPTTLAMIAVDEQRCTLQTPLDELISAWHTPAGQPRATLEQLLNHSSGLPAWHKYYEEMPFPPAQASLSESRRHVIERVLATPRVAPATRYAYSDLGFIALMVLLEELFETPLSELARARIFKPLGMDRACYVDLLRGDEPLQDAVATELTEARGLVRGVVHDENTHLLGGVSGHAGVFGTARDLARFGDHLLGVDSGRIASPEAIVSRRTLGAFLSPARRAPQGHHLAGWDTPSGERSSAGRGFRAGDTVGHLGFTGTSIWLERESGTCAVLLTNRVHPTRENPRIFKMRVAVHEAILPPPPL